MAKFIAIYSQCVVKFHTLLRFMDYQKEIDGTIQITAPHTHVALNN
jgi:hypothetical protein